MEQYLLFCSPKNGLDRLSNHNISLLNIFHSTEILFIGYLINKFGGSLPPRVLSSFYGDRQMKNEEHNFFGKLPKIIPGDKRCHQMNLYI